MRICTNCGTYTWQQALSDKIPCCEDMNTLKVVQFIELYNELLTRNMWLIKELQKERQRNTPPVKQKKRVSRT